MTQIKQWFRKHPVVPIGIGLLVGFYAVLALLLATATEQQNGRTVQDGEPVLAVLGLIAIAGLEVLWIWYIRRHRDGSR